MNDVVAKACARIAPTWPLDRFIAVNPFWGCVDEPMTEVAATLRALSGAELVMPRAWFREAYALGRLTDHHLAAALRQGASSLSLAELKSLLASEPPATAVRPRVVDVADEGRDPRKTTSSWRAYVTNAIGQFCAAYFDDGQATTSPDRSGGLYASWRRQAPHDRGPALAMSFDSFRTLARTLPGTAEELIAQALEALEIPEEDRERYLWSLLLDQNGWASWCAYRRRTARLKSEDDWEIRDLLAIRLAWEWLVLREDESTMRRWKLAAAGALRNDADHTRAHDWLLQAAAEAAWRGPVVGALRRALHAPRPAVADVQAVFCIDVRSEIFRRAFEAIHPSVATLGFAGFFGLPLEYVPPGAADARPHLPGLLAPRLRAVDEGPNGASTSTHESGAAVLQRDALSTFQTVESVGLGYAWKLALETLGLARRPVEKKRPRLVGAADGTPLDIEARADLAAGMLRAMSLTQDFARLILLVGHGSTTRNNPHAAGLDCGACGGQSGEVNARVAAALLNDAGVRAGLRARGIDVPATTWFVAALHDTTTDDVTLFDVEALPATHRDELPALRAHLRDAGAVARAERVRLLRPSAASSAEREIRRRSTGWAEVRPEWGLARNAALIVAPRERTAGIDLAGRAFLHEYRHERDEGYRVLELIMTAPMVVAHWINLQYYASTVDNLRYGSGNKVLHNVVGGHLGVLEGNAGDLRIGLPMQSVHDGERWIHEPLRLAVFIEAPRVAIDAVIERHPTVKSLVEHGWIALFQLDSEERAVHARRNGGWHEEGASS